MSYIFIKLFSGAKFALQIACLYFESFKGNKDLNLTILKKSPSQYNIFGIIADARGVLPHCAIIFRKLF